MATKLNLTSQKILDEVFPGVPRGYDPLLVDQFLDKVIQDYLTIESNELVDKQEIDGLRKEVSKLKAENQQLLIENGRYKTRMEGIGEDTRVTRDNMELIRTIHKYETWLFNHGININDIK